MTGPQADVGTDASAARYLDKRLLAQRVLVQGWHKDPG
jgi:hypothetical protein